MAVSPVRRLKAFWAELMRRRVVGTTVAYVVVGYLLVEAASLIFPQLLLPEWTVRAFLIIVIMGLPIVIVLAWLFDIERPYSQDNAVATSGEVAPDLHAVPPLASSAFASVAVLPFHNLSPNKSNEFLVHGISAELHSTLGKMHQLRVAARTSAYSFSNENVDIKEIARKLNVQFVITGSVRCVDDDLRITVELDDALEGIQIWAETYERDISDIFAVQQDIAYAVTSEFGSALMRQQIERATTYPTANLDAWNLVQRARSYVVQFTPNALNDAIPLLKQAIELDGDYAIAHAALASAIAERVLNGLSADQVGDRDTALHSIDHAYRQTPGDPFVLKMCGAVWAYFGRTDRSIRALRSAVEIAQFDFGAWGYMGWPLAASADRHALAELSSIMRRIIDSSPHHPGVPYWQYHLSVANLCSGDEAAALNLAKQSVDHNPAFPWGWMHYANILGNTGAVADGRKALARCAELSPTLTPDHFSSMISSMSQADTHVGLRTDGLAKLAG